MILNTYKNKVVIVTGHTGFKGSWLTQWLLLLGAKVVGVSNNVPSKPSHFESLNLKNKIIHQKVDVRNLGVLVKIFKKYKPDYVFHLAGQSIVKKSFTDPIYTWQTNTIGTLNILESLRVLKKKCFVVLITSDKSYKNVEIRKGYKENDILGGHDPYSASKAGAELAIQSHIKSFFPLKKTKVFISVARAGNVIGGGDWSNYRLIPDCIKSWIKNKNVILRNPKSTRPWQHVLDPLSGYLNLAIRLSKSPNKFYGSWNFGPEVNKNITVKQIIELSINEGLDIRFSYNKCGEYESNFLSLSIEKSKNYLKWIPKWDCEFSVKRTINWYLKYYQGKNTNDLLMDDIKTFYN